MMNTRTQHIINLCNFSKNSDLSSHAADRCKFRKVNEKILVDKELSEEIQYENIAESQNKENKDLNSDALYDENKDLLIPLSPEDPFHTSEDSSYIASSEENDSLYSSPQLSSRVTRSAKFKTKDNEIKEGSVSQTSINSTVQHSSTQSDVVSELQVYNENISVPEEINTQETVANSNTLYKVKSISSKTPYKRIKDNCYFCETHVQNFARHLERNHSIKTEVAQILSKPKKSTERRELLNKLKRKGNFLASGKEGCFKAVRKSYVRGRSVLPCDNCLGFFSAKLLYRHRKKCIGNNSNNAAQSMGQSKLVTLRVDQHLKNEVFPHMRADKVSLEAKNDALICAFGTRYFKTHRDKHFINVTSRKMRELAKILMEMRKMDSSINTMFSALQPKYFDFFVAATKNIAKFDIEKDIFLSPTFAMNIVTSLKQCCDIAITYAYKNQPPYVSVSSAEVEADLKTLIHLFQTNWRFEISSQASNNLNLNKWNKITVVPLANDLRLLRQHLIQLAELASKKITESDNKITKVTSDAYNDLVESVYCRVILLNRKRSGELQRMQLHTYVNCTEKQQYEEFNKVVSPAEQILLKTLKRVVIKGKRGRGVPVLFSVDVQKHIETLLKVRQDYVPKENMYLFAKVQSITHIIGYKVLTKHAQICGAKNPQAITSTRLRKHLATLSQLFNLSDNEIEQLSTFMGHTTGVHRGSYRLPDDIYQTTKISKLLLLMEKGIASEFKGKSLDEIQIDMEEDLLSNVCDDNEKSVESDYENIIDEDLPIRNVTNIPSNSAESLPAALPKRGKCRILVPWTSKQKQVTKLFFKQNIKSRKPPKRSDCEELKSKYPELLQNKDWQKIKVFIQNEYSKKTYKND